MGVEKLADHGTSEPFISRIGTGIPELLGGVNLGQAKRDSIQQKVLSALVECLIPAFDELQEINAYETGKKTIVRSKLDAAYMNLYTHCWRTYKDRLQSIVKGLGYDIGFLYDQQIKFESGLVKFRHDNTDINPEFERVLKEDRDLWQNELVVFRNNYIEHQSLDKKDVQRFFRYTAAQTVFSNTWQAMEEMIVVLLEPLLPVGIGIGEIPESERDESNPKRFRFITTDKFIITPSEKPTPS